MPQVVRITSKRPGFRRAGLAHPDQPVEHPIDRFTKAELAALKAEPMLVVDIIDRPDPEPGDGKGKGH